MKERASKQTEAVWAYLHDELTVDERSAFEQDLQGNAELRRVYDDASRMDRLLRETLPILDQADASIDEVAEQALACWEREYDSAQKQDGLGSRWAGIFFHPAVGLIGLAAAAIILLVAPLLQTPDGLIWDDPVFSSLTLRGALSSEEQGSLSDETALRCQALLQRELERALALRTDNVQTPLVVSMQLQELRNGAFSLSVQVRTHKGESVGEWSGDYSGEAAFKEQVGASAEQMAETLAFWPHAEKGSRP